MEVCQHPYEDAHLRTVCGGSIVMAMAHLQQQSTMASSCGFTGTGTPDEWQPKGRRLDFSAPRFAAR